jgi:transposase-like protein
MYTKRDIAKLYGVTPRTVSNWLSRAREDHGENFPGNYEGNAIAFTDDQIEVLLEYSNKAEMNIAAPQSRVIVPDIDVVKESQALALHSPQVEQARSLVVNFNIQSVPVAKRHTDTTQLEANTDRNWNLGQIHAQQALEGFAAYAGSLGAEAMAQLQELQAAAIAQGAVALNQSVNGVE